jgi:hypothetical protein
MVAQPPFSMTDRRFHDETLLNSTNFAGHRPGTGTSRRRSEPAPLRPRLQRAGLPFFSAVLPSVHPRDENPTTANATAPATAPHIAGFTPGWIFSSPWLWEKRTSRASTEESYRAASPRMLDSETTQSTPALLDCRILATVLLTRRRGAAHVTNSNTRQLRNAVPCAAPPGHTDGHHWAPDDRFGSQTMLKEPGVVSLYVAPIPTKPTTPVSSMILNVLSMII